MKKINSSFWMAVCLILTASGFLGGCGFLDNGAVKIKMSSWGDMNENAILVDEINEFEKLHPHIQVTLERAPFTEYVTKLLTQIAGGVAPDVVFVEVDNFADFYFRNVLEPLTPYMNADHFSTGGYFPQVINRFTMNHQLFVMPRDTSPICVIFYNKNIFDECHVPYPKDDWTWDDFTDTAQKLTKRDANGNVKYWGFADDTTMSDNWVYGAGGGYVDNIKRPTQWTFATDPHTLRGLQFRADLISKYKVMIPPTGSAAMGGMGNSSEFVNGRAAMFLSGYWKVPNFRSIKNFQWDIAMQPQTPDGHRGFPTGGSGYGILSSSKHKKECWELIKFLSGEEGAKKMAETGLLMPAIMNVANSPAFLNDQEPHNKKILLDAVQYSVYDPFCANWNEVRYGIVGPELDRIWNNTETPEQALAKLRPVLAKISQTK
jgi:ABC-type glycerol-3-phosphate transport system substrate-binding protein